MNEKTDHSRAFGRDNSPADLLPSKRRAFFVRKYAAAAFSVFNCLMPRDQVK